jgi:hypothetical protein
VGKTRDRKVYARQRRVSYPADAFRHLLGGTDSSTHQSGLSPAYQIPLRTTLKTLIVSRYDENAPAQPDTFLFTSRKKQVCCTLC